MPIKQPTCNVDGTKARGERQLRTANHSVTPVFKLSVQDAGRASNPEQIDPFAKLKESQEHF